MSMSLYFSDYIILQGIIILMSFHNAYPLITTFYEYINSEYTDFPLIDLSMEGFDPNSVEVLWT